MISRPPAPPGWVISTRPERMTMRPGATSPAWRRGRLPGKSAPRRTGAADRSRPVPGWKQLIYPIRDDRSGGLRHRYPFASPECGGTRHPLTVLARSMQADQVPLVDDLTERAIACIPQALFGGPIHPTLEGTSALDEDHWQRRNGSAPTYCGNAVARIVGDGRAVAKSGAIE